MNFFGHAVVAGWMGAEAPGVLGSMIPDFESMLRVRVVEIRDLEIQRGIELHHQTDDVFHRSQTFLSLCSEALSLLTERGVRRGTARAVAHIGTELFLDGWLATDSVSGRVYQSALDPDVGQPLDWADEGQAFARLHNRLRHWGPPHDYREPSFVLARLNDALKSRPRLAILQDQQDPLAEFLPELQALVTARAPELLHEVQNGLGLAP